MVNRYIYLKRSLFFYLGVSESQLIAFGKNKKFRLYKDLHSFFFFKFKQKIYFYFSFYVFSHCGRQLNSRFQEAIKIYLFNSLVVCTNALVSSSYSLAVSRVLYSEGRNPKILTQNYEFNFYQLYFYVTLSTLSYVFRSHMDIFLTWSRIQAFKPNYKFLAQTSVIQFIFSIFLTKKQ